MHVRISWVPWRKNLLLFQYSHDTHDIPHGTKHPPRYSKYPPTNIMISSRYCTPPRYWTNVIQDRHGRNHSHTRCEYVRTIFLFYRHYSEYSLLGSNFQLLCCSQRVNARSQHNGSIFGSTEAPWNVFLLFSCFLMAKFESSQKSNRTWFFEQFFAPYL